jgi:hypothetical protein
MSNKFISSHFACIMNHDATYINTYIPYAQSLFYKVSAVLYRGSNGFILDR